MLGRGILSYPLSSMPAWAASRYPAPKWKLKGGLRRQFSDRGLAWHERHRVQAPALQTKESPLPTKKKKKNVVRVEYLPSIFKARSSSLSSTHRQGVHLNIMSFQPNIPRGVSSEVPKIKDQLPHPCPAAATAALPSLPISTLSNANHCPHHTALGNEYHSFAGQVHANVCQVMTQLSLTYNLQGPSTPAVSQQTGASELTNCSLVKP